MSKTADTIGESVETAVLGRRPRSNRLENPFLVPFTPSKRMKILRASLTSDSATSYLVSTSPTPANIPIITPQCERPEPFTEPEWDCLLAPQITSMGAEDLAHEVNKLRRGLVMARDCLRARDAVIESAHATNVVLELTCQRQRNSLHRKEEEKLQKKDKRSLFSDGKAHVVTDDDFTLALEEIEEREKEKGEDKEKRKVVRAKAKEHKEVGKRAWEQALEIWKQEKAEWEQECERLKEGGHRRKDLPKAPKKPRKADVIHVAASNEGNIGDDENGDGEVSDSGVNNRDQEGSGGSGDGGYEGSGGESDGASDDNDKTGGGRMGDDEGSDDDDSELDGRAE